MKRFFQLACALLLFLGIGIAACSPMSPATREAVATLQSTPAEAYHPLTTRTGIEGMDQILDAVASGDMQSLRSLVEFTNAKCTLRDGLGGPPKCLEGEVEGTPVEVLSFLSSEGSFLRREEIEDWQGINVSGLYAIYEVSAAVYSEEYYPVGKYVMLFMGEENQPAVALRVGESGIVRVDHIFGASPQSLRAMLQREASSVILAPRT